MLWSSRRAFLISVAALAGCGFQPAYDTQGMRGLYGQISYSEPTDQNMFHLRQQLEQRLGASATGQYRLDYSIETQTERAAVAFDGQAFRQQIHGEVTYTLTQNDRSKVILSGKRSTFVGYASTGTTTATLASERDANRRLMVRLADLVVADILIKMRSVQP
jgi:LPS-assembly lipoprotein